MKALLTLVLAGMFVSPFAFAGGKCGGADRGACGDGKDNGNGEVLKSCKVEEGACARNRQCGDEAVKARKGCGGGEGVKMRKGCSTEGVKAKGCGVKGAGELKQCGGQNMKARKNCGAEQQSVKATTKPQQFCPVMGKSVGENSRYVAYNGKKIKVCCSGCVARVKADPAKYAEKLAAKGVELEAITETTE